MGVSMKKPQRKARLVYLIESCDTKQEQEQEPIPYPLLDELERRNERDTPKDGRLRIRLSRSCIEWIDRQSAKQNMTRTSFMQKVIESLMLINP